ncbi:phosphotransferase [Bacillus sp. FSL K6-3431]|uniref:phosphotransferase n=1 Tax=Bacillus sp. FSL K6-3431 TaxID=2921500 RepID=UPI0030FB057C
MKSIYTEEMILDDLIKSCRRIFGFTVRKAIPIKRGWLNLKWKVITDSGVYIIKQYNKERYKLYVHEELLFAFSQQMRLFKKGFQCPELSSNEGQFLFQSDHDELFIVMKFCEGNVIPPGRLNIYQMYDLGRVTGKMHQLLNDGTIEKKSNPVFIPPSRENRLAHWHSEWNNANNASRSHLLPILETQYKVTETIEFRDFNLNNTGWAHRDLWVDNLLFKENKLTAVLDFDRMKYDYPQLDVARAILSGALIEDGIDITLATAFMKGYGEERLLPKGFLADSLKLLWYMESTWWINSNMDQHSGPPARFTKEMIWLAENQNGLDSLLG